MYLFILTFSHLLSICHTLSVYPRSFRLRVYSFFSYIPRWTTVNSLSLMHYLSKCFWSLDGVHDPVETSARDWASLLYRFVAYRTLYYHIRGARLFLEKIPWKTRHRARECSNGITTRGAMCMTIESSLPLPPLLCSALRLPSPCIPEDPLASYLPSPPIVSCCPCYCYCFPAKGRCTPFVWLRLMICVLARSESMRGTGDARIRFLVAWLGLFGRLRTRSYDAAALSRCCRSSIAHNHPKCLSRKCETHPTTKVSLFRGLVPRRLFSV